MENQEYKPVTWPRFIDDIFFICSCGEEKLKAFLENLNRLHPDITFTHESSEEIIPFSDFNVKQSFLIKRSRLIGFLLIK